MLRDDFVQRKKKHLAGRPVAALKIKLEHGPPDFTREPIYNGPPDFTKIYWPKISHHTTGLNIKKRYTTQIWIHKMTSNEKV
jgi:hypothetical protein